ncbi:MAG: di-heme oxidoredictase family protein [Myxococcota bacterium]
MTFAQNHLPASLVATMLWTAVACSSTETSATAEPESTPVPSPEEPCPSAAWPSLGVVDARVDVETAQRYLDWRTQREQDRLLEELEPAKLQAALRIEQRDLARGCYSLDEVVDLGRLLFLRDYTKAEGHGHDDKLYRFHTGRFGGPDATSCQSCHWKGGEVGAGDRVDNAYLFGDGDDVTTADLRNPVPLWGAGWMELVASEMSQELAAQADALLQEADATGARVEKELVAKGVSFGRLAASLSANGQLDLDTSAVLGVDSDLVVKPFGWKGTYRTLREIVGASLQLHLGLQPEEVVEAPAAFGVAVGEAAPADPDGDGVEREFTAGQVSALVLYLATQDAPPFLVPEEGVFRPYELYSQELEFIRSPEYVQVWTEGYSLFRTTGCATCHVPFLPVEQTLYRTKPAADTVDLVVDIATEGAKPVPPQDDEGRYLVAAFSDFKRHDLGAGLKSLHDDRGVPVQQWFTRPLWGLSQSSPYLHQGDAMVVDDAIARHGGEGEEAKLAFLRLSTAEKEKFRFFLASLARAPRVRVR